MKYAKDEYKTLKEEWSSYKTSLEVRERWLNSYSYNPLSPNVNDTYDKEDWKNYWIRESDFHQKLFLFPCDFELHSIEEILTVIDAPEIMKLNIPPSKKQPENFPDWYGKRSPKEYYFKDNNWCEEAANLFGDDFVKNQIASHADGDFIENTLTEKRGLELKDKIEQLKINNLLKQEQAQAIINKIRSSLSVSPSDETICTFLGVVNSRHFLPDYLRKEYYFHLDKSSATLVIQFEFPDYSRVHIETGKTKTGIPRLLNITAKKRFIKKCLYSLIIRAGYIASNFNIGNLFKNVVVNVNQSWFDPATGQAKNGVIASLQAPFEKFKDLDVSKIDPETCFKSLKGINTPSLENISPIRPIFVLNKDDDRFVESKLIDENMIPESNLAAMEWEEFEHLVAQLFEWEFAKNGVEVKVTRTSRDRGVDAILFDPDPLRGGKYVLQAKRYTRTVDVSAVRDLYGTVVNEGANKGILITTAEFGPDSYEFVKDKPLALVNGQHLLFMLQKHGKKFKIDLEEARRFNNS